MNTYDGYVWRLYTEAPYELFDVVLPKDLEWIDEFTWSPISSQISNTVTGSLVIQEYKALTGREITLQGKDDMAWADRETIQELANMRDEMGLVMNLQHVSASHDPLLDQWTFGDVYISKKVIFNRNGLPIEVESVKRFDNFQPGSQYKINNLRFLEIGETDPFSCS